MMVMVEREISSAKMGSHPNTSLWLHSSVGDAFLLGFAIIELRLWADVRDELELGEECNQRVLHLHQAKISPGAVSGGLGEGEEVVFVPRAIRVKFEGLGP